MEPSAYQAFLGSYKKCIVHIIEEGYATNFEKGQYEGEMVSLWNEIYSICLKILSTSINLIYSDTKEILMNLSTSLESIKNDKQAQNCSISLSFLSLNENAKQLIANTTSFEELKKVLTLCCQLKTTDVLECLKTNSLGAV